MLSDLEEAWPEHQRYVIEVSEGDLNPHMLSSQECASDYSLIMSGGRPLHIFRNK